MIEVTEFVKTLDGKPVAVFGLGISNLAAIRALCAAGGSVVAWDDNEARHDAAREAGASVRDLMGEDLSGYGCLVLAPGVPLYFPKPHVLVEKARDANIEILCDLEILHRCCHGRKVIGITGTNGKSTTTALIGHMLNECGIPAVVGGNIGTAALALDLPPEDGVIVLEISSFQMDLCPSFIPDIAVHLNLSPDHIDRHGSMEGYIAAKRRMFYGQGAAVIGVDDTNSRAMRDDIESEGTRTIYPVSCKDKMIDGLACVALPGDHNRQNVAAAAQVGLLMGLLPEKIMEAINTFPGLPHRQYLVRTIGGVSFVNDSKATNADAAEKALLCYDDIFWIVGGKPKEGGLKGLEKYRDRIAHAYVIGAAADDFAVWLGQQGIAHTRCGTLDVAVSRSFSDALAAGKGVVLLSPACASFDQFSSFEERGNVFAALVNDLKEEAA